MAEHSSRAVSPAAIVPTSVAGVPIGRMVEALSPRMLDIGARGGADEAMLPIAWASRIVCFEPDPAEAAGLARTGDPRWREFTVLPFAVGGVTGPQELHVPMDAEGASLLVHNPDMIERFGSAHLHDPLKTIPVETWTLNDLQSAGHIDRIDYMKVDVEGAELDILRAGTSVLADCVALKVECSFLHQRIDQPLIWDVAQFLEGIGFEVLDLQGLHRWRRRNLPSHPYRVRSTMPYSRGQVAQCDLTLLKSATHLRDQEQALRLVLVSAALGFFDYAITVLRKNPELAGAATSQWGLNLEVELQRWSAATGERVVKKALAESVRALVPLIRAWAGRLPFPTPRVPY
ncbi:MAG TPA: FkbM family methyltransferase [Vicinamibacterales bacterium]|nr:FkbM family methyltransferase [Vicinamibacterales bacterium]